MHRRIYHTNLFSKRNIWDYFNAILYFADICIKFIVVFNPPGAKKNETQTLLLYFLPIPYSKYFIQSDPLNFRGRTRVSCTTVSLFAFSSRTTLPVRTTARRHLINTQTAGPNSLSIPRKLKAKWFRHFRKKTAYNLLISKAANIVRAILFPSGLFAGKWTLGSVMCCQICED